MAVRFLKSTAAVTPNRTLRPSGYTFPAGLNLVGSSVSADYLVIAGGGGAGTTSDTTATAGTANLGGGGGGCYGNTPANLSGAGGSGIVVVRYAV